MAAEAAETAAPAAAGAAAKATAAEAPEAAGAADMAAPRSSERAGAPSLFEPVGAISYRGSGCIRAG